MKRIATLAVFAILAVCCSFGQAAPPAGRTLQGIVKSGNTPVPGATVTALNPSTGQKVVGWTAADGSYRLQLPGDGDYTVRAQMSAFATAVAHVNVTAANRNPRADLQIVLLSRAQGAAGNAQNRMAAAVRGFQALSVMQGEAGDSGVNGSDQIAPSGMPVPGIPPTVSTESVAVSGSNTPSLAGMSTDELRSRFGGFGQQGGLPGVGSAAGGGPGGGGFGGGFGGGRGGGMRMGMGRGGFNLNQPHGAIYYSADDASLDAAPFALRGIPTPKPNYLQQRFGALIGGPLIIPHIYNGGTKTFFFLHYNGTLGDQPFTSFSTVPTLDERNGNFANTLVDGSPVQIFNPATGLPFYGNIIPQNLISSQARGLLNYIPLPNLPGDFQNFQYITAATSDSNDFNIRVNQALGGNIHRRGGRGRNRGPQNDLNFGFHYHGTDQTLTNAFPSVGGKTTTSNFDVPIGYVRSFGKLINNCALRLQSQPHLTLKICTLFSTTSRASRHHRRFHEPV